MYVSRVCRQRVLLFWLRSAALSSLRVAQSAPLSARVPSEVVCSAQVPDHCTVHSKNATNTYSQIFYKCADCILRATGLSQATIVLQDGAYHSKPAAPALPPDLLYCLPTKRCTVEAAIAKASASPIAFCAQLERRRSRRAHA
jgi:hypothetical protein